MSRRSQSQSKRSAKSRRRQTRKKKASARVRKRSNAKVAKEAMDQFFGTGNIFSEYRFHGNIRWCATMLAKMALIFSWSEKRNITDAFDEGLERANGLGLRTVHTTYQGFMGALTNYSEIFIGVLIKQLQRKIREYGGRFWKIDGFVPIAFDGSRNSLSRTKANEKAFCSVAGKRKAAESPSTVTDPKPQIWITMMWHMGCRLPWDWKLGPSDSSERDHVEEMVTQGEFPENTLFCGDAGFVGYPLWKAIIDQGHDFMIRVGRNVRLIELEMDGQYLSWPKDRQTKGDPPLRLRCVTVKIGTAEVHLLTSVLCESRLSEATMIELYKKRWGIEIEFRGLKQTLRGHKLKCRNADRAYTEMHWNILAMAVAELLALKAQVEADELKQQYSPKDISLANTMKAINRCLSRLHLSESHHDDLFARFRLAVTDSYVRNSSKKARFRPTVDEKVKKKIKPPRTRPLENRERERLDKLQIQMVM